MPLRRFVAPAGLAALLALAGAAPWAGADTDASQVPAPEPPAGAAREPRSLRFERDGALVARVALFELRRACAERTVEVDDPYYARRKRFVACPLEDVLERGFGAPAARLAAEDFFLHALDGYTRPASGRQLFEGGAFLAFADADHARGADPGWQPIDRRQLDPGPFYLVWTGAEQGDPHRHPWPYQLARIEIAPFERAYPHTVPRGAPPGAPARAGFEIFRAQCFACHAINGEGGKVGPDLNVPRSIVEYRPAAQIKAYIRNPQSFRYTTMPAHPNLSDEELGALIAYFEAMRELKHDPGRTP